MKEYIIKFEFLGRTMRTVITANSKEEAKQILYSKIDFKLFKESDFTREELENNVTTGTM